MKKVFLLLAVPLASEVMENPVQQKWVLQYIRVLMEKEHQKWQQMIYPEVANNILERTEIIKNELGAKRYELLINAWGWYDLQEFFLKWAQTCANKMSVAYEGNVKAIIYSDRVVTCLQDKKKKEIPVELSSRDFMTIFIPLLDAKAQEYDEARA